MRKYAVEIILVGILCFAVAVSFSILAKVDFSGISDFFDSHKKLFLLPVMNVVLITLLIIALRIAKAMANLVSEIIVGLGDARWQTSIRNVVRHFVITVFLILAFLELLAINVNLAPDEIWARWAIAAIFFGTAFFGWRFFLKAGQRVSRHFAAALEVDEKLAKISREITFTVPEDIIGKVSVSPSSCAVGRSVGELNVRAETGATIVSVVRGETRIRNVGPRLEILSGDTLVAMGDEEQIEKLRKLIGGNHEA